MNSMGLIPKFDQSRTISFFINFYFETLFKYRKMTIIAACVYKDTESRRTGLKFTYINGNVQIREIVPNGLFARVTTPHLRPGMRIISVNNIQCDGMVPSQVVQLIRGAKGNIILVVDDDSVSDFIPQATVVSSTLVSDFPQPSATAIATPVDGSLIPAGGEEAAASSSTTTAISTNGVGSNRPPPGRDAGGIWGTAKYWGGDDTRFISVIMCLLLPPFGLCMAHCPQDQKDAYRINGRVRTKMFAI